MRDLETMQTVLSAAETGHLVFFLAAHTTGAASRSTGSSTSFRLKRQQIRVRLSMVFAGDRFQRLVPAVGGGLIPAFEILKVNNAVQTQIRENKIHQIDNTIQANAREGMITMDASLLNLLKEGKITKETVLLACTDPDLMRRRLSVANLG